MATIISFFTATRMPLKIFKVHDQLLIELKDKKILNYQIARNIDENEVRKVVNYINQKHIKY
ncbi:hypothetical protein [Polaribacter sp. 11A2H]|uniref:hypothetical protein n=1 Tax=Polaribacter sp. 11A2H TaxID=2687290 RepID=UPI00197B6C99|nr:hypothetical protein [Polaribacter sp. 11A2H]